MTYCREAYVQASLALVGRILHAGLVGIEEIVLAILSRGEVRHYYIGSRRYGLFPSPRVYGLVGGRRYHIDPGHHQTGDGYHLQCHFHPFLRRGYEVPEAVEGSVGMGNIWPQADHCNVHTLEKQQVRGEMVSSLEGKADHYSGPDLVAGLFQAFEAVQPAAE